MNTHDDDMLVELLATIQPQPGDRFYAKVATMPWMREPAVSPATPRAARIRWGAAVAVLLALIAVAVTLITPPGQTFARDLLGLFTRQQGDVATKETLGITDADGWINDVSVADLQRVGGLEVWQPVAPPAGYKLLGISYLPNEQSIMSAYEYADAPDSTFRYHQMPILIVLQQPAAIANRGTSAKIGASASIETVSIGDIQGDFVQGAWTAPSSESKELEWVPVTCCRVLRWQRGDLVFTLQAHSFPDSPGYGSREVMIAFAEQMEPVAKQ